jgi:hypothetical protein
MLFSLWAVVVWPVVGSPGCDTLQAAMNNDSADENSLLQYIINLIESLREEMATKGDIAQMATKSDLAQVEARIVTRLEAETTAIRGDIEQVHLRLDSIERALTARL